MTTKCVAVEFSKVVIINDDSLDDLIVGAPLADPDNNTNAGKSFVVFGKTDTTTINTSE
jgi:hypothetical protein